MQEEPQQERVEEEEESITTLTLKDVQAALERIRPFVHETPVLTCASLEENTPFHMFFKCENLQKTGSFKYRGASNFVLQLTEEQRKNGVVTHSSGNHAQALACAAHTHGVHAHIVMPENAPAVKRRATERFGPSSVTVYTCASTQAAREEECERVRLETAAVLAPPYDHFFTMAGQGTIALEFLAQVPTLDCIIVPVGGGGMLSGIALAAKSLRPSIKIIGAEPAGADDAYRSFLSGVWQPQENPQTIADGLRTSLGTLTWPVIQKYVDDIVTVSEEEIVAAMKLVFERLKTVIEPSAGVGVAVALSPAFQDMAQQWQHNTSSPPHVGIILCGGNLDLDALPWM